MLYDLFVSQYRKTQINQSIIKLNKFKHDFEFRESRTTNVFGSFYSEAVLLLGL